MNPKPETTRIKRGRPPRRNFTLYARDARNTRVRFLSRQRHHPRKVGQLHFTLIYAFVLYNKKHLPVKTMNARAFAGKRMIVSTAPDSPASPTSSCRLPTLQFLSRARFMYFSSAHSPPLLTLLTHAVESSGSPQSRYPDIVYTGEV